MQHILLFTFVMTGIIFFTMFWGATERQDEETASDSDSNIPKNDSNTTEVVTQQRKSDVDSMPSSSGNSQPSSSYSVLGVN